MYSEDEEALPAKMLRPLNTVEMSRCYGVHYRTFQKWLKPFEAEIGDRTGRYFSVNQIRIIVKKLGLPSV